jgi:hypothetical protein|tara:strand:- start:709 stop:1107 length:399 start_codon:yes stop_codon:yes gene_type:complete
MIQAFIGPIANLAGTWLQGKVDKSKADSDVKVARAKAEAKVYETEATSQMLNEKKLTDQMGDSWKDEAWSLWFIAVLTACFLPWTQEYVKEGFIFLDEHTPTWFHNMLYIVIGSSFGYRFGKQGLQVLNRKK